MASTSGAAKIILTEQDLSARVAAQRGAYVGGVAPLVRGPVGVPVLYTNGTDFLKRTTAYGRVKLGYDTSYLEILELLGFTNKVYITRAARNARYGAAVIRKSGAGKLSAVAEFGPLNPETDYDLTSLDGRFVTAPSSITFDAATDIGTTNDTFYGIVRTGDKVRVSTASGTLPTGLDATTDYYVIKLPAADKVKLAASLANANAGTAIDLTTAGSGALTITNASVVDEQAADAKVLLITGTDPGVWNNDLAVIVTNYATNPVKVKEPDAFVIDVYQGTSRVESFTCSRRLDAKDLRGQSLYVETVVKRSAFIRVMDNLAVDENVAPADVPTPLALGGGTDGDPVTDSVMIEAAKGLYSADKYTLALVTDLGWATSAFQTELITLCETRGDCAAVFSAPYESEMAADPVQAVIDYKTKTLNSVSSYAGIWSSYLNVTDTDNNRDLYIAPSAHVAGKIAQVWDLFAPWQPAAGNKLGVLNVNGVLNIYDAGQMDVLYDNNVNPIRWSRGKGTVIWGQKTLQTRASDLDRFNARLLLCLIKPALKELTEDYLFDLNTIENNKGTRASLRAAVEGYMKSVKARGGLYDFKVICDSTNNSDEDVKSNILRVWLLVKIIKDVEYIPFNIGVASYDMSFEVAQSLIVS